MMVSHNHDQPLGVSMTLLLIISTAEFILILKKSKVEQLKAENTFGLKTLRFFCILKRYAVVCCSRMFVISKLVKINIINLRIKCVDNTCFCSSSLVYWRDYRQLLH